MDTAAIEEAKLRKVRRRGKPTAGALTDMIVSFRTYESEVELR